MMRLFRTGLLCLFLLGSGFNYWARAQGAIPAEVLESGYADLVLYNGKVLTVDEKFTIAQAVAVKNGKIVAVADSNRILKFAGPKTERIDLQSNTLIPGFVNVHGPYGEGGHGPGGPNYLPNYMRLRVNSLDQGLRDIGQWVEKAKPGEWVFVNASRTAPSYQLTMELLDQVAPNNPLLVNLDNTTGFVNGLAFRQLPPDIPAGIHKDQNGKPTGKITGWAYGTLTYEILPWPTKQSYEEMVDRQRDIFRKLVATGVTTYGSSSSGLKLSIMRDLYVRGEVPLRIRIISEVARQNAYTERHLKRMGNIEGVGDDGFRFTGMTLSSVDGISSYSGFMTRRPKRSMFPWDAHGPYGENKFHEMAEAGKDWREYSDYKNALISNRFGWSVYDFHAHGDAALELMLEIIDEMNKDVPIKGNRRVGVVHGTMRPPDLAKRLVAYDALSSHNADLFAGDNSILEHNYGADAVAGMQPIRDLIDIGLRPILEIRAPTIEEERAIPQQLVLDNMEGFVTRKNRMSGKVLGPHLKVTKEEILRMATIWAARYSGDEKVLGSIESGKLADFVILGADYLTVPDEQISDISILRVIVGGKTAYSRN